MRIHKMCLREVWKRCLRVPAIRNYLLHFCFCGHHTHVYTYIYDICMYVFLYVRTRRLQKRHEGPCAPSEGARRPPKAPWAARGRTVWNSGWWFWMERSHNSLPPRAPGRPDHSHHPPTGDAPSTLEGRSKALYIHTSSSRWFARARRVVVLGRKPPRITTVALSGAPIRLA